MPTDLNKLIQVIETMAKSKVRIGIPEEENARKEGDKIGNAALAFIHQNGSPANHIPPRPFMTNGVNAVRSRIVDIMEDGARHAVETTNPNIILQVLHKVGAIATEAMKDAIDAGIPPPLSPITVARRMIRSPGSNYRRKATPAEQIAFNARFARGEVQMSESPTTPLHDTGNLLRAINYVIDEDGKER
jgi:hypothetical protein